MSLAVISPTNFRQAVAEYSATMFTSSLVATTAVTNRPPGPSFNFSSPKNSPRLQRAASPGNRRLRAKVSSMSPGRDSKGNGLTPSKSQPLLAGCAQCQGNQVNNMVSSINKLSLRDNCGNDLKIKETILGALEPKGISSMELSAKITDNGSLPPPLVVDCRSFISYNLCHIKGAMNIGCTDRLTKKRLQSGKLTLCQVIKCALSKERFLTHSGSEVVIYDDSSSQISTEKDCSIRLVGASLAREGKRVYFLKGGLAEFYSLYQELCEEAKPPANTPLYSPTTPIVSDDIDTAKASRVLPFLYIGNERDAANLDILQGLGITHILNCTSHIPLHFESQGLRYRRLPASDSGRQNLSQYFEEANEFIEETRKSGGRVLVHCQAGVSRSVTITMAYIMKHSKMVLDDIFKYVKSKRSIVAPNLNFMGQLMEYEQSISEGKLQRELGSDLGL